ncbi:MAG: CopD family protein [Burkholderiales bacterium]
MTELAAAIRFFHIAAVVVLAGGYVFLAAISGPALRSMSSDSRWRASVGHFILRWKGLIAGASLLVIFGTLFAGLALQILVVGDVVSNAVNANQESNFISDAATFLTGTLYGNVWLLRLLLAIGLAVVLMKEHEARRNGREPVVKAFQQLGLLLSLTLLASISLSGHAAAGEGIELLTQTLGDALHLLAAGAWLGALPLLIVLLRRCASLKTAEDAHLVREITWRFSRLGLICVATLLVTGCVNAWLLVGGIPQLVGTPYGHWLLLKLALIVPMLGVAAINLCKINPAINAETNTETNVTTNATTKFDNMPVLAASLARNALIEAALGVMILAIVGLLGTTPPARHMQVEWPFDFRWDWGLMDSSPKTRGEVEVALAFGLLGLFVLQFAFLSRRFRKLTAILGSSLAIYASYAVVTPIWTDAYPSTYRRPTVFYNAISVANGKRLFEKHCVSCHGAQGYGDGPAAESLNPKPADLTGRHANAHTVGDLYWWVTHGKPNSAMQGFGDVLDEDERWDLINTVRAMANGRRARGLAAIVEDKLWLAAPDFSYLTSQGESRSLRDFRGAKSVLLVLASGDKLTTRLEQLRPFAARLGAIGVEIIAVPRDRRVDAASAMPVVNEGNGEIHDTYALFVTGLSDEDAGAGGRHLEFLIDKQGYLRARWSSTDSDAWRDPAVIAVQVDALNREVPRLVAPLDHAH